MDFLQYTAGTDDDGRRLDRVIRIILKDVPMSEIYKFMRKGLIRLNGKKTEGSCRIKKGDVIQISKAAHEHHEHIEQSISMTSDKTEAALTHSKQNGTSPVQHTAKEPFTIDDVFRNEHIRIINKPYGMSVHGGGSTETTTLEQIVTQQYFQAELGDKSLSFKPGPLHRIDRHTTGLVVFSQSLEGANIFSKIIQNHEVKKEYLAVLCGDLCEEETWEDMISNNSGTTNAGNNSKKAFHTVSIEEPDANRGKKARTKVIPVSHGIYEKTPFTLARVEIETGRKHQIRSQCSYHGYPLLGDTAYNGKNPAGINGHFMLHAWRMTFQKGNTLGLPEVITAPLPTNFHIFLKNHLSQYEFSNYNDILV